MKELLQFAWNVLLFRHEAYAEHVARADVLKRGLLLLVAVTLFAGMLSSLIGVINNLRTPAITDPRAEARAAIDEFADVLRDFNIPLPPDFDEVATYVLPGMEIGFGIAALPTPLPRFLGTLLTAWGGFLSLPLQRLGAWLAYTIWVMLAAKLLGGKGKVAGMLGATALYALPHVLGLLDFIPCLGGLLGLAATLWGIAIYVKGLAVASDFSIWKALVATLLPGAIQAVLIGLGILLTLLPAFLSGG